MITVAPRNLATFQALRFEDEMDEPALILAAAEAQAKVQGWIIVSRKGRPTSVFRLIARNRKRYDLAYGDWLVILGTNGSIRVCTDREFKRDYKEVEEQK